MATNASKENQRKIFAIIEDSICDILSSINQLMALSLNLSALNAKFDDLDEEDYISAAKGI
jgi:hypothetical protein